MNWFKKKVQPEEAPKFEVKVSQHEHTWKDMPWYIEKEWNGRDETASYKIIEPFICLTCGERKNMTLEENCWRYIDSNTREKWFKQIEDRYRAYLKPRAVVEDMINNILLVKDPEHLDMMERLRGTPHRKCGTSATMNFTTNNECPKLKIKEK